MSAEDTKHRMKDYKKTSMLKGIVVFDEFLRKLEQTWKGKRLETSGKFVLFLYLHKLGIKSFSSRNRYKR
jgi:hypothetical protein